MMDNAIMDATQFAVIAEYLSEFDELLLNATDQLNIDLSAEQRRRLLMYLDKLLFWNKAYNLTAIKQPKEALIKHIFDCLAIIPHLHQGSLLDIGTGAGLPGVIVAICEPQRSVTVLDSNQKKIRFIKQIISDLTLTNVTPIASRIEHYKLAESEKFAVVTSRAFASLSDFVDAAAPRLAEHGYLQAMKGLAPTEDDIKLLQDNWQITATPLVVPMLNETRHTVELQHKLSSLV